MSKITQRDYNTMIRDMEKTSLIVSNNLGEHYVSESLVTLRKVGSRVKAQFLFNASANDHPLNVAWLYISGDMKGVYQMKPPITDISAVSALNMEWEI